MNTVERKLADLIHQHPNLYDQSRQDYKDSTKTQLSWKEIADAMGKSEEEVKMKWKNLRDKFCKAKKRLAKRNAAQLGDEENPPKKRVPALYSQLVWLSTFVKLRAERRMEDHQEVIIGEDDQDDQDEQDDDNDEKLLSESLPVVSTSFLPESCPISHPHIGACIKRKRQTTAETEISSADPLPGMKDEDELFLLSLLPSLKRLTIRKRMEVRMKFQQVLYAAEFED
ncbi:uncharacterized protein LOC114433419 isoform X1 [Parambassis ranga]|uniref:Uncharacterized protein LOC114433419 isoform X1 n=1 Tax=Parambassis ranga TaxID=210632 RepID=A0A6P7I004_9TELE|nr:uncharacterized protein LOC114433419 isoform X1 [Parambassis ranga]